MKFSEKGKFGSCLDLLSSGTRKRVFRITEVDEALFLISLIVPYTAYLFG